jgi:hypothetical protein
MKPNSPDDSPMAPSLVQLDDRTLVSVRLARTAQPPNQFRAVALSALRSNHRVHLSSARTVGYGPNPEAALEACLGRVRETLTAARPSRARLHQRRPAPNL